MDSSSISLIISVISLIVGCFSFFLNYFVIPSSNRKTKAEDEFIKLLRLLIDNYANYQNLLKYNDTPQEDAKKLKEKILIICELMNLNIKRIKNKKIGKHLMVCLTNFIDSINDKNYNALINQCKSYLNSYK